MRLDEPSWWYAADGGERIAARLLAPLAHLYGAAAERRFASATPLRTRLPVICVGNFTAGGTGKTPLSRFLLAELRRRSVAAAGLSRGYGGALAGPVWVDPARHSARDVGDEPLLIAQSERIMVSRDRAAGLQAIVAEGDVSAVVMDDGLQNPSLAKDLSIAIVDAGRALGNGRVIPSGPLRARLEFQLGLVDCIVVSGVLGSDQPSAILETLRARFPGPVLSAAVAPAGPVDGIDGRPVLAFAGIANPVRFFRLLGALHPAPIREAVFPDHHDFTEAEAVALLAEADRLGAELVTTEKDAVRLHGAGGTRGELAARARTLPITMVFNERDRLRLDALIDGALNAGQRR